DLEGFLAGCSDDVTFGTFKEDVLDVFANDDHALMLLHHEFDREGTHREYRTAHILELRDGLISTGHRTGDVTWAA
ncbi:MAG: hypothetical protein QOE38_2046, partial [Thermoleophilaceae bacterium]|nr:hypothetical protein [Thermoleophilaceae bacterium]